MNAHDILNAWRDYKIETGNEEITLSEFRQLGFNKEERHPGRSLEQCVFDKDFKESGQASVALNLEGDDMNFVEPDNEYYA